MVSIKNILQLREKKKYYSPVEEEHAYRNDLLSVLEINIGPHMPWRVSIGTL